MKVDSRALTLMKIKFSLFFVLFVAALFAGIAINSVRQLQQAAHITVSMAGLPVLQNASALIDGDKYELLTQTLDESDPFYQEMQARFRALKRATQCLYLYTMAPCNGGVHRFIFDAEDPASEYFSSLGAEEDVSGYDSAYMRTYETKTPQFTRLMFQSKWGRLISAYMPIFNSRGGVVGIIGVDFQGKDVYAAIASNVKWQLAYAVALIVVGLFIYFLLLKDLTRQNDELLAMSRRAEAAFAAPEALLREALTELKAALTAGDTGGLDTALTRLRNLQPDPQTYMAAADITKHVLFGDFKKALEAVNAWLERG
jgi:hypothetical protein